MIIVIVLCLSLTLIIIIQIFDKKFLVEKILRDNNFVYFNAVGDEILCPPSEWTRDSRVVSLNQLFYLCFLKNCF